MTPERDAQPAPPAAGMPALVDLPALLANAPHRLMFFAGASAVLVSMSWWACVLAGWRFGWTDMPQVPLPVPAGWAHSIMLAYGMLPMFMFGFLLTVFPRWMNQPALTRRDYVPVFAGVFGGYLICHVGLLGSRSVLIAGLALMLAGYLVGLFALGRVLLAHRGRDQHAVSAYAALITGFVGLSMFFAFVLGASPLLAMAAIELGLFGLLLPVYFTVCHRMIPFFSASMVRDYRVVRPRWSLPVMWLLLALHVGCTLSGAERWRWLADLPLCLFFAWHVFAWQPWKARRPGLLAVLHLAILWLPLAFVLYAWQSLALFVDGEPILGRIPAHILTIGFFGSMLVAMVTRVTHGHSGRPLQMSAIPWLTFAALQGVVVLRVYAEFARDSGAWLAIAACAWIVAFLPWVLRSIWITLTPRIDGNPG